MRRRILETREKIAVSVLNGLCQHMPTELVEEIANGTLGGAQYIKAANVLATNMLGSFDAADRRIEHAEARARRAEDKFETLQSIHVNMQGENFDSARVALTQIWELLGVYNQTAAMAKLRDMVEVMNFLEGPDHATLMERLRLARMEHSI